VSEPKRREIAGQSPTLVNYHTQLGGSDQRG